MTHEQMIAWLVLEGWECCSDGGTEHYPAAFHRTKDKSYVLFHGEDPDEGIYGGDSVEWVGATTWDKMKHVHVHRLYDAITKGETK